MLITDNSRFRRCDSVFIHRAGEMAMAAHLLIIDIPQRESISCGFSHACANVGAPSQQCLVLPPPQGLTQQ